MKASTVVVIVILGLLQMQDVFAAGHNDGALTTQKLGSFSSWVKCMSGVVGSTVDDVSAIMSRCAEEVGDFNGCLLLGGIELVQDVVLSAIKCAKAQ
ncbi:hypothetical protein FOCC_FOCC011656 [Frankliniella occidentalis]|nr:hypothetical protein FOCC_FOCC011656 [Frankliniella occidentalis]